jgi:hypothetical protein
LEKLRISIDDVEHGNAIIEIEDSVNNISIFPSYIDDGLENLLIAILLLNKGLKEVDCSIYCEPTWDLLSFKQGKGTVDFNVYTYEGYTARPSSDVIDKSILRYSVQCKLKQLTNQIINAFYHLKNKYGIEEYKKRWNYDFPEKKLDELQELIKNKEK